MEMALGFGIPLAVVALFFLLKTNAALLFFIACACALLFDRGTKGVESLIGSVMPNSPQALQYIVPALLVLPLLIGVLIQSRHGKKWLMVQLLPAIACGLVIYILSVRTVLYLYHVDWRAGLVWPIFSAREDLLIAVGMFISLIAMPLGGKGGGGHDAKHGKH